MSVGLLGHSQAYSSYALDASTHGELRPTSVRVPVHLQNIPEQPGPHVRRAADVMLLEPDRTRAPCTGLVSSRSSPPARAPAATDSVASPQCSEDKLLRGRLLVGYVSREQGCRQPATMIPALVVPLGLSLARRSLHTALTRGRRQRLLGCVTFQPPQARSSAQSSDYSRSSMPGCDWPALS